MEKVNPQTILTTDVDVLWIARYDYPAAWTLRLHHHDYYQMILFLDGRGLLTLGEQTFQLRGGELCLIRPGDSHGLRAYSLMRTLDVKFRIGEGAPLDRALRSALHPASRKDSGIAVRLERIRMEGEQKLPWYRELCSALLSEILFLYLRQGSQLPPDEPEAMLTLASPADPMLDRALACIRARHPEQLTVRDIALASACTERTLRQHFQSHFGMAPLAWLQRHRVERAKELIRYSDYTLKEVARKVGFQTINHFTRHFTRIEKQSPAAWRHEYLEGIRKDVYINPAFENPILTIPPDSTA